MAVAELSWPILVILPSLVFFVALPLALRSGMACWAALALVCAATALAYGAWIWGTRRLGIDL